MPAELMNSTLPKSNTVISRSWPAACSISLAESASTLSVRMRTMVRPSLCSIMMLMALAPPGPTQTVVLCDQAAPPAQPERDQPTQIMAEDRERGCRYQRFVVGTLVPNDAA